jgi:muconolactone D-isomerase
VEFLVEVDVRLPPDLDDDRRVALLKAEADRGRALAEAGTIRAIWRIPGRLANCAIWSADDPTQLHDAIISLPLWPYMQATVTPLARHGLADACVGLPAALRLE